MVKSFWSSKYRVSSGISIWVDADACPKVIREILYRAANRVERPLTLVANHVIPVPNSPWIKSRQVPQVRAPNIDTSCPGTRPETPGPIFTISALASAPIVSGISRLANAMPRQPQTSR